MIPGSSKQVVLPVGALTAYAGNVDAATGLASIEARGWLPCDGRELDATAYPELFAALGYSYGGSDGRFRVPDYRGVAPLVAPGSGDCPVPSVLIKFASTHVGANGRF